MPGTQNDPNAPPWWLQWFAGGALWATGLYLANMAICAIVTSGTEDDEDDEDEE